MVKKSAITAGSAAAATGVLSALHLLPGGWPSWVAGALVGTYAACAALERVIATGIRACDLVERVEQIRHPDQQPNTTSSTTSRPNTTQQR